MKIFCVKSYVGLSTSYAYMSGKRSTIVIRYWITVDLKLQIYEKGALPGCATVLLFTEKSTGPLLFSVYIIYSICRFHYLPLTKTKIRPSSCQANTLYQLQLHTLDN